MFRSHKGMAETAAQAGGRQYLLFKKYHETIKGGTGAQGGRLVMNQSYRGRKMHLKIQYKILNGGNRSSDMGLDLKEKLTYMGVGVWGGLGG